jgi:hypothetical protein
LDLTKEIRQKLVKIAISTRMPRSSELLQMFAEKYVSVDSPDGSKLDVMLRKVQQFRPLTSFVSFDSYRVLKYAGAG